MTTLHPPLPQAEPIARTIDEAFTRLDVRMAHLGDGFAELGAAMRRAAAGGKRFRPVLVVRSFIALGGDPDDCPALLPVAAAFELLHTAFVIHDDVIDDDTMRRGIPNVRGEFRARGEARGVDAAGSAILGDAAAILAGDLLLHEAQRLIAVTEVDAPVRARLLDLLDDAVLVSAAGELADVEHSVLDEGAEVEAVLAATRNKTAVYSFSAPLRAGVALARADERTDAALDVFGARLGLAFQLVDDLIGAFGTPAQAGRASGADIAASKHTSLVALARDSGSWPRVKDALALAHTGPVAVRSAQRALDSSGARARLHDLVIETINDARAGAARADLPIELVDLLYDLADEVERRIP